MATITDNSSHPEQRDATRALRDEIANLSLAGVADSMRASRYAVSAVDAANVPVLVGAQVGGNTGTQGFPAATQIIGRDSVQVAQTANLATVQLVGDSVTPAKGSIYGASTAGALGYHAISTLVTAGTNITVTVNADGSITVSSTGGGGGNPWNVKNVSATYTVAAADIPAASAYRGLVSITSASANNVKLDTFANTAIPVGSELLVLQNGTGATTISGLPGVTLIGPSIAGGGQYSSGTAIQVATDTWLVSGNLAWLTGPPSGFYAYALSLSPVAYWRMNETSGTTLTDVIGAQVATLTGSYTLNQAGMVTGGASVLFSGGYASTAASSTWALGTGDFSVFFIGKWIATSLICPLYIRDGSNLLSGFFCNRLTTGDAETEGWYWASGGQIATTGTSHNNGLPHSFCCTYVASTKTLYFYFDGNLIGSKVVGGTRPTASTMKTYIASNTGVQPFSGNLAELVLFNYALTSTEVSNLASYVL